MTFCKMEMGMCDYGFISHNENGNTRMKMDSFHNENEMSPAGRGPQNESQEMEMDSLWQ